MFKYILPTILITITIIGFFVFTDPLYKNISLERSEITSYNEALGNSKTLEAERDKLTQKYNSFDKENLSRLKKLLPDSIDNIRLILEIGKIALPYGMVLKNVKYDVTKKEDKQQTTRTIQTNNSPKKDYGAWDLEFSTQGTYNNFINFIKDLENNLRIVDIYSIEFSSSANTKLKSYLPEAYKYNLKIRTYWLKN